MIRRILAAFVLLSATASGSQEPQRAAADAAQPWTTVVRGTVTRSDSGSPVAGVQVSINLQGAKPVVSDGQGRFAFENVRPGTYNVFTFPDGYINDSFTLAVGPDQPTRDVPIVLTPLGAISGTVRDATGQPLVSVRIEAKVLADRDGRLVMTPTAKQTSTNDRGQYRLSGLPPGEYFVRAEQLSFGTRTTWPRAYHPAAIDPAGAAPIVVAAGADVSGRDITVPAVRTFSISGTIDNQLPDAIRLPPDNPASGFVTLVLVRVGAAVDDGPLVLSNAAAFDRQGNGPASFNRFEIRGVPPGVYDLYPLLRGRGGESYSAATRVTVVDRDLAGVVAAVRPGVNLNIRDASAARMASRTTKGGQAQPGPVAQPGLELIPRTILPSLLPRILDGGNPGIIVADDQGTFAASNVLEGTYDIGFWRWDPYPPGEYLSDITQGGRSVLESGLTITRETPSPVELVFSQGAATISGTVRNLDRRLRTQVVLLPRASGRRRTIHYKAVSSFEGTFSFTNVPPGSYLLFACVPTVAVDWSDRATDALIEREPRVQMITVRQGATQTVSLDTIDGNSLPMLRHEMPKTAAAQPASPQLPSQLAVSAGADRNAGRRGVIAGRLLDENGNPVRGATMTPLQPRVVDGRHVLARVGTSSNTATNDLGEFRIFWLAPGSYYLAADSSRRWLELPAVPGTSFANTYYPGVTDSGSAQPVAVADGETRADFRLGSRKVHTVSGRVTTPDGVPVPGSRSFYLVSRDAGIQADLTPSQLFQTYPEPPGNAAAGDFTLRDVPAGTYDVYALLPDERSLHFSVVVDRDVAGLVAVAQPAATITMRLTVDGRPAPPSYVPRLVPIDTLPALTVARPTATANADGSFSFKAMAARYQVEVGSLPLNMYVSDVRAGGASVFDRGLVIGGVPPGPIDVALKTDGGTVRGNVTTSSGAAAAGLTVLLAPAPAFRQVAGLYRIAETDSAGRFVLPSTAPGEYKVFVWEDEAWESAELPVMAARYEAQGQPVVVRAGESSSLQLRPIPRR